jgi:hypothetical protein
MSQYQTLNREKHRRLRVRTGYGAALGDAVMYVMTYPMEFRDIQGCYPILFTKDPNTAVSLPQRYSVWKQTRTCFCRAIAGMRLMFPPWCNANPS